MAYAAPEKLGIRLYRNKRKDFESDNEIESRKPDFTGNGELPIPVLKAFVARNNDKSNPIIDGVIKLRCSGWKNVSKQGNNYMNIIIEIDTYGDSPAAKEAPKSKSPDPFDLENSHGLGPPSDDDVPF